MLDKQDVAAQLLRDGSILVEFTIDYPGVHVPERFRVVQELALRFGYDLTPPIDDLWHDDYGIRGTLSFNGVPFMCHVPWGAVTSISSDGYGHHVAWPPEVAMEIEAEPPRPKLKLVD
jgi:hypothetical protein